MWKEIRDFMATTLQSLPTQRERVFLPRTKGVYFVKAMSEEMHRKGAKYFFSHAHFPSH